MFEKIKEFIFGKPKKEVKPLYKIKEEEHRAFLRKRRKDRKKALKHK